MLLSTCYIIIIIRHPLSINHPSIINHPLSTINQHLSSSSSIIINHHHYQSSPNLVLFYDNHQYYKSLNKTKTSYKYLAMYICILHILYSLIAAYEHCYVHTNTHNIRGFVMLGTSFYKTIKEYVISEKV